MSADEVYFWKLNAAPMPAILQSPPHFFRGGLGRGAQNENEIENEYAYEIVRFSYSFSFSISFFNYNSPSLALPDEEGIATPHATAV